MIMVIPSFLIYVSYLLLILKIILIIMTITQEY